MPYHVYFALTSGLSAPVTVPKGAFERVKKQIAKTESVLGIERETYRGEERWNNWPLVKADLDDKAYCDVVREHNCTVRWLYECMGDKKFTGETEQITPEMFSQILLGLRILDVPPNRWTADYYIDRMQYAYEVMRGRECEGSTLGEDPLTDRQAAEVINLFAQWLDTHDVGCDVPRGHDSIGTRYYGDWDWCDTCFQAIDPDDMYPGTSSCEWCARSGKTIESNGSDDECWDCGLPYESHPKDAEDGTVRLLCGGVRMVTVPDNAQR